MILRLKVKIGYKRSCNILILSKNLTSAIEDLFIINKKLEKDIHLQLITFITNLTLLFILLLLDFVFKYDGNFKHIHYLSYPKNTLVNNYILNSKKNLKYTKFLEVFNLIVRIGCYFNIIKKDIKNMFKNIFIAL